MNGLTASPRWRARYAACLQAFEQYSDRATRRDFTQSHHTHLSVERP